MAIMEQEELAPYTLCVLDETGDSGTKTNLKRSNCYETPVIDTMISQFLMLQTDEAKFLKTANHTRLM